MGNWFWSQLFWCYCACVCIMCVRLAGRGGGWGGACVCVCVCVIFAFAFSIADRKRVDLGGGGRVCVCVSFLPSPFLRRTENGSLFQTTGQYQKRHATPGTSCVWSECEQYMNQQMSEETGRECTTEEDQQNTEVQNILPSFWCCLMSSDVG